MRVSVSVVVISSGFHPWGGHTQVRPYQVRQIGICRGRAKCLPRRLQPGGKCRLAIRPSAIVRVGLEKCPAYGQAKEPDQNKSN